MNLTDRVVGLLKTAVLLGREMGTERHLEMHFPDDIAGLDKELEEYLAALTALTDVFDQHSNLVTAGVSINVVSHPSWECGEEQYKIDVESHGDHVTVDLKLLKAKLGFEFVEYHDFDIHDVYTYDNTGKHFPLAKDERREFTYRFLRAVSKLVANADFFVDNMKEQPIEPQPDTLEAALRAGLARLNHEKSDEAYKSLLELYRSHKDCKAEEIDWVRRGLVLFKETRATA
jgi:hypothetical protein